MRVGICQSVVTSNLSRNLAATQRVLRDAASEHCHVVVFPECALTGYLGFDRKQLDDLDPQEIHEAIFAIQESCRNLRIACVVGQYFKRCGRWYNNAVAIGSEGKLLVSYDKHQLVDRDCYEVAPGQSPAIFELDGVRCSLAICHDIRYPEILGRYGSAGVQVHFHPFYGWREPGEQARHYQEQYDAHLVTRAVENGFYLVAANVAKQDQMVRSQCRDMEGRCLGMARGWEEQFFAVEIDARSSGDGWAKKRRADLFDAARSAPPQSYFERAVWERKSYMISHERGAETPASTSGDA